MHETERDLRYPIGRFVRKPDSSADERLRMIDEMEQHPARLRVAVEGLDDTQLDTPYRPDGWTVRQVVHHVVDSHLNSYIRFKWALTEDDTTIKVYDQDAWSELEDARTFDVDLSLAMLETLHARWCRWLRTLSEDDWSRTFQHPEWGTVPLHVNLQIYAWHGEHHLAHVTGLRNRMGW